MKKNHAKTNLKREVAFPRTLLAKPEKSRAFAIYLSGDGMNDPRDPKNSMLSGDILIVEPDETVTDGDVALVGICDEFWMVRRWYRINDDEVELVADNPTVKPLIKKQKEVKILGKVIFYSRPLKGKKKQKRRRCIS